MRLLLALTAVVALANGDAPAAAGKKWALIVAGSNGWGNYRHQADVCHAYHVLHGHGIPDENIVVMMYDDIANNSANPYPGKLYNKPHGKDVYAGVPKDYVGRDVTPDNFLKIMQGTSMKGVGSGKTIASTANDHVFVFFSDHGATGLIAFPSSELHVKQLNDALMQMHIDKKFAKLVFYLESCESGSMFRNVLPANIGVYALTASDYDESSWGCYCSTDMNLPCLGDLFSVNWMEDSDAQDLTKESLLQQHDIVQKKTDQSKVMEYGDLTYKTDMVSDFQGDQKCTTCEAQTPKGDRNMYGVVPVREMNLWTLHQQLERATTAQAREQALKQISLLHQKREYVDRVMNEIVGKLVPQMEMRDFIYTTHPQQLTKMDCHLRATQLFSQQCFSFAKNEYVMKYSRVLANLCEVGVETQDLLDTLTDVCSKLTNKPVDIL